MAPAARTGYGQAGADAVQHRTEHPAPEVRRLCDVIDTERVLRQRLLRGEPAHLDLTTDRAPARDRGVVDQQGTATG